LTNQTINVNDISISSGSLIIKTTVMKANSVVVTSGGNIVIENSSIETNNLETNGTVSINILDTSQDKAIITIHNCANISGNFQVEVPTFKSDFSLKVIDSESSCLSGVFENVSVSGECVKSYKPKYLGNVFSISMESDCVNGGCLLSRWNVFGLFVICLFFCL